MTRQQFERVYFSIRENLYGFAYIRVGDEASDVVQDVYVRGLTSYHQLSKYRDGAVVRWLYRICSNLCIDIVRKKNSIVMVKLEDQEFIADTLNEDDIARNLLIDDVIARIDKSPRVLQCNRYIEYKASGMELNEFCEKFSGQSKIAVRSFLIRERRNLRDRMLLVASPKDWLDCVTS